MDTNLKRIQKTREQNFPARIYIETTNICTQSCTMCSRGTCKREEGFIKFDIVKQIIDEGTLYHNNWEVDLFKEGEPLLHHKIIDMIKYAADRECITQIATNGILLNTELSEKLIESGLTHLLISTLISNREENLKLKLCDNFNLLYNNVKQLKEIRDSLGAKHPIIRIKTLDRYKPKDFAKVWQPFCDYIHVSKYHNWDGTIGKKTPIKNRYPCAYLWFCPAILWDGDVSPCCVDYRKKAIIGNIYDKSFYEIWNGKKLKEYRNIHLNDGGNIEPCDNCIRWSEFKRWTKAYY